MHKSLNTIYIPILIFSLTAIDQAAAKSLPEELKLAATNRSEVEPLPDGWKIVQFWASWCVTCDQTMESLASLNVHEDTSSFSFVPVSVDEKCQDVDSYFTAKPHVEKFAPMVRRDPGGVLAQSLKLRGIPTVILVDPAGEVVEEFVGHPSQAQLDSLRRHLHNGKKNAESKPSH